MNEFFVTFGQNHPLRDGYILIFANKEEFARQRAFEVLGNKWSFLYTKETFKDVVQFYPAGQFGQPLYG